MTAVLDRPTPEVPSTGRLFGNLLRSEWTKLRSVRSTLWSLAAALGIVVGIGTLISLARVARWERVGRRNGALFDPTAFSLAGIFLAQLAVGVLGVLVVTSEYSTGQIRATLGAAPQRLAVLWAKLLVFLASVLVVATIGCFAAFAIGQRIFASKHAGASLGDPHVLRAVIGGALYLTVIGAFGVGLGTILRRTAGAIAVLVGVLLIAPIIVNLLPDPWNDDVGKFLPGSAGGQIWRTVRESATLSVGTGFAVFCLYAVVALAVGAFLLRSRDA